MNTEEINEIVLKAAHDAEVKNEFLISEQQHILKLTAKIAGKSLSMSDDEWSVGLNAVSEAIDSYSLENAKKASFLSSLLVDCICFKRP